MASFAFCLKVALTILQARMTLQISKCCTILLVLLCLSFGFKTQVVIGCCTALKDKQKVLRRTTEELLLQVLMHANDRVGRVQETGQGDMPND